MYHLLSIDELTKLLAKHILADNMLDEETIRRKAKIYILSWQKTQQIPKNEKALTHLHIDGLKYQIMKRHYETVLLENLDEKKSNYEINRLREIMDLIEKNSK